MIKESVIKTKVTTMVIWLLAVSAIIGQSQLYGQTSSNDNYNILFQNDFEDNQLGDYSGYDFCKDWNITAYEDFSIDMVLDSDPGKNKVMRGNFAKGSHSITYDIPYGFCFYSYYPEEIGNNLEEAYFSYDIKYRDGFDWVHGGKMPGLKGGDLGDYITVNSGFSARPMWSDGGQIVFYVYHQDMKNQYGDSWGWWEDFKFETEKWYNVTFRVVLNSFSNGKALNNGILEGFIDGKLMFQRSDLKFRSLESITIDRMSIDAFFGGGDEFFAATRDEWIDYDNFVSYTYNDIATNVPRGYELSSSSNTLLHPYYNSISSQAEPELPAAPSSLAETSLSETTISLGWEDNAGNEQGFKLYRSTSMSSGYREVATLAANTISYVDNNLNAGTTYYYKLLAFNQDGNSDYSPVLAISTLASQAPEEPAAPSSLAETSLSETTISLGWEDNAGNEQGFKLYRSTSMSSGYREVATLAANTISYVDNNLNAGTTYYYKLLAFNQDGNSDYSAVLAISTLAEQVPVEPEENNPVVTENNPPLINDQYFSITESSNSNYFIGKIASYDPEGQVLRYDIISGNTTGIFTVNENTGELKMSGKELFSPGTYTYTLGIKVTDNASVPKSAVAKATIKLTGQSTIVYIDPGNVDDELANGSIYHPYGSWEKVSWKNGFTYMQRRGTTAKINKIIIGANKVTLGAYGEGELPVISSEANTYLISGFEKSGIKIQNLNLQSPNAVSSIYFLGNSGDSITIEHCIINGYANAIKVVDGSTLISKYNTISSNSDGIYSTANSNEIYYNIFKNCMTAVNIASHSSVAKIFNNVFFDNEQSLSVSYAELTLYNNIFFMTKSGQVAINHGTGKIQSNHNIFYPEQSGFIKINNSLFDNLNQLQQKLQIDLNSFNNDPLFIDMYNENFSLNPNSPAINSGIDLMLGIDFTGNSVPSAGATDIGVYEYKGASEDLGITSDDAWMRVYPNPSSGQFNILAEFSNDQETEDDQKLPEVKVFDLTGKTVFAKQLNSSSNSSLLNSVDITGISNGMYLVVLQIADKILQEKILIQK